MYTSGSTGTPKVCTVYYYYLSRKVLGKLSHNGFFLYNWWVFSKNSRNSASNLRSIKALDHLGKLTKLIRSFEISGTGFFLCTFVSLGIFEVKAGICKHCDDWFPLCFGWEARNHVKLSANFNPLKQYRLKSLKMAKRSNVIRRKRLPRRRKATRSLRGNGSILIALFIRSQKR